LFFFFSSRRRHTRFDCDWSSDVCSSDLAIYLLDRDGRVLQSLGLGENGKIPPQLPRKPLPGPQEYFFQATLADPSGEVRPYRFRSEERRVGKECRCRWWRCD